MRSSKKINSIALLLIIILAATFRYVGIWPGYPDNHPDEGTSYNTAVYMFYHNLKPDRVDYPAGMPLIHLAIYMNIFLPVIIGKLVFFHPNFWNDFVNGVDVIKQYEAFIFGPGNIYALYWSRFIAVSIGVLTVYLLYAVTKYMFTVRAALIAAFFLAVNYRHVLGSHFGLPDVHNAFFTILALSACAALIHKQTWKRYALVATLIAVAISIKFLYFILFTYVCTQILIAYKKGGWRHFFSKYFIFSLFLIPLVFLILNPHLFDDWQKFYSRTRYTALRYNIGEFFVAPYPYFYLFHWGIGPLPSVMVLLGAVTMIYKKFRSFLLISSFIIPFAISMIYFSIGYIYPRNFVTIIPLLMIFAGYFLDSLYSYLYKTHHNRLLPIIMVFFVLAINTSSVINSGLLSLNYQLPWNTKYLESWVLQNIPENTIVYANSLYISGKTREALSNKNSPIHEIDYKGHPISLSEMQKEGADLVIFNMANYQGITYWWRQSPEWDLFRYPDVPFDYITNGYFGLVLQELMPYTVYEVFKPWQASYENSYLVFKIPPKIESIGKQIITFQFNTPKDEWMLRDTVFKDSPSYAWASSSGHIASGALKLGIGRTPYTAARLESQSFPIIEGRYYTIKAWIKNDQIPPDNKKYDGFIRVDFYTDEQSAMMNSIYSAISDRAPNSGEWQQVSLQARAPINAKFATVGFQRVKQYTEHDAYIDDVEIYESPDGPNITLPQIPYIQPTIRLENMYYNSFL